MGTIKWCNQQSKGIKLIEPNTNLFHEYIATAEETLHVLQKIKETSNIWISTTKYYAEYFAAYALLMKIGISCEIHECTIMICKFLESEGLFPKGYSEILEKDKQLRIDNQYYLKNRSVHLDETEIYEFIATIKKKGLELTSAQRNMIRKKLTAFSTVP